MSGRFGYKKRDILKLRYGMIHSQLGFSDGVSIVMDQIESVLRDNLEIPEENIFYLVGKSGLKNRRVSEDEILWDRNKINRLMLNRFEKGYGGCMSEKIEGAILKAKGIIKEWVEKNKIDVLIVHNSSHPVNFISSIALSRYYRDAIKKKKKTPKYILWWHDSHLERDHFSRPEKDVEQYLLEGVPGRFVEYILFINRLQFDDAKKYFMKINKKHSGFCKRIASNYNVAYNTTDVFINSFKDLRKSKNIRLNQFVEDFKIRKFLDERSLRLKDILFCLQHTRAVKRKRIDFALKYCYELLKKSNFKSIYFLVSGQSYKDGSRKDLEKLNKKLTKEYELDVCLVFAEDYKTSLSFVEYPRIFAKLGGFSTYFSEVEGFGNNLLEVLASGLIPVVYKYPVFKKDIEEYNFELVALDDFKIRDGDLRETLKVVKSRRKRRVMVDKNLEILKRYFPHSVIALKLVQAITRPREHK